MTQCSEMVTDGGRWPSFHQCTRYGKVEREGKAFCTIHDPVLIAQRQAEKTAKWNDDWNKKWERERKASAASEMYEALLAFLEVGNCKAARDMATAALAKADGKERV